jgi:hypothetical protein
VIRRAVYGPPNWLVDKFSSEDRRAFGFWTIVFSVVGAIFFGREVLYVTILSIVALIPNFASETPVEVEETTE